MPGVLRLREPVRFANCLATLRIRDFFEVAKNRRCKPSGYDDHIVENSKKSQTLRAGSPLFSGTKLDCFSWPRLSFGDLLN